MPATIRAAAAGDIGAIAATHVRADAETYRPIMGERFRERTLPESEKRWRDALAASDVLLVAEDRDRIVGFAHAHGAWMNALYLLASHHRQGLGSALFAELGARVADRGVTQIEFQCVAENARAIAFYEAMGARRVGRKTEREGDAAWEEVIFRLETGSLAAFRRP